MSTLQRSILVLGVFNQFRICFELLKYTAGMNLIFFNFDIIQISLDLNI